GVAIGKQFDGLGGEVCGGELGHGTQLLGVVSVGVAIEDQSLQKANRVRVIPELSPRYWCIIGLTWADAFLWKRERPPREGGGLVELVGLEARESLAGVYVRL
ncbi:MAG TPA: hypothetical protein VJQ61_12915, partial [Sinomonas sp.]|nr:hypothetical protein [Sinomonas sp.]